MRNPPSARGAHAVGPSLASRRPSRRSRITRVLPVGAALSACLLLAAAAAVDGQAAALVLALWVGLLVVVGVHLSESPETRKARGLRLRTNRRPVLVLSELDENGGLGATRTLPVVASETAIAVLDSRPRG
jgi:hypothetical protein